VELNRGSRAGVREGTVAVYNGAHLIGRVERVALLRSHLLPLCSAASGLLRALVLPRDRPEAPLSEAAIIQLEPKGNGTFTAELSRETEVSEGDLVMLADHTWPESAQAMVIGTIESVRVKDDDLLRNELVERCRYQAHELRYVTLKVELDEEGQP
jgi:cell shape-determining protein MreC